MRLSRATSFGCREHRAPDPRRLSARGVQTRAQEIANAQQGLAGEAKTQGEQQLTEQQQLAEKAYADQLDAQNRTRDNNTKIAGGGASFLASLL